MGQWEEEIIDKWRKIRASSRALKEGCGKITSSLQDKKINNFAKINLSDIKKYTVPIEGKEHEFNDILEEFGIK